MPTRLWMMLRMIGRLWYDLPLLIRLLLAWKQGRYPGFSARTLVIVAGALLYLLSPVDLVPDFIPGVGVIDDLAVLALLLQSLAQDLAAFRAWEQNRR
ncbi:MAG: YkvA family protein [Nitrospira sp.]|nr:YkvA family protein [Nitrospira sp.]MCP9465470.1 YkvA family protein [Nitrospira sp.]